MKFSKRDQARAARSSRRDQGPDRKPDYSPSREDAILRLGDEYEACLSLLQTVSERHQGLQEKIVIWQDICKRKCGKIQDGGRLPKDLYESYEKRANRQASRLRSLAKTAIEAIEVDPGLVDKQWPKSDFSETYGERIERVLESACKPYEEAHLELQKRKRKSVLLGGAKTEEAVKAGNPGR